MAMNCLGREACRTNGVAWIITVKILHITANVGNMANTPSAIIVARQGVSACGLASGGVYLTHM